ncbi:zinc finger protein [Carpediemonas membranifera]|uniref:Zinc finger protein n=1 Tax=Carpediemonas membranifera TaxID=201153 RepID=A0A8J6AUB9_9EUKA|nr:zinc finger protein [Carpediemonas membranifera]|eukprot:KAG9394378.1 zinc finger protein [Carpediemonas membranifera]
MGGRAVYKCRCMVSSGPSGRSNGVCGAAGMEECGMRFQSKGARDIHVEQEHGKVVCIHQYCGKGFDSYEEMMAHMRSTDNHKHLICPFCGDYAAHLPNVLVRHIIAYHPETLSAEQRKKYWCDICQRPIYELCRHYAAHHPEMVPPNAKGRFWCEECGRMFENLGRHKKMVHRKGFLCPVPDCTYRCGLISHMKQHLLRSVHNIDSRAVENFILQLREQQAEESGVAVKRNVRRRDLENDIALRVKTETKTMTPEMEEEMRRNEEMAAEIVAAFALDLAGLGSGPLAADPPPQPRSALDVPALDMGLVGVNVGQSQR